jgi:hypothetical protein
VKEIRRGETLIEISDEKRNIKCVVKGSDVAYALAEELVMRNVKEGAKLPLKKSIDSRVHAALRCNTGGNNAAYGLTWSLPEEGSDIVPVSLQQAIGLFLGNTITSTTTGPTALLLKERTFTAEISQSEIDDDKTMTSSIAHQAFQAVDLRHGDHFLTDVDDDGEGDTEVEEDVNIEEREEGQGTDIEEVDEGNPQGDDSTDVEEIGEDEVVLSMVGEHNDILKSLPIKRNREDENTEQQSFINRVITSPHQDNDDVDDDRTVSEEDIKLKVHKKPKLIFIPSSDDDYESDGSDESDGSFENKNDLLFRGSMAL